MVVGATAYHWAAVDTFFLIFSKICSQNWVAILKKQKWWLSKLGRNFSVFFTHFFQRAKTIITWLPGLGNAVLLPKVGNENTKTRQISSNFVRFFTKNHEKEEKLYDFTQFREARLPKLGKIIQQVLAEYSILHQVD